ncbi:hypothetical protein [Micromonospora sp. LOL_024]|uniref:hypothetical protein n=1 Tax=Micromonospora sp. LOL_024 TaxID=3345412 RepID=UPI003A8B950F
MDRSTRQDGSSELSRRAALRAGAVLAFGGAAVPLAGCGLLDRDEPPPRPDPLAPLIDEALQLATGLRAAATAHPDLTDRLVPLAESHESHATELTRLVGATAATPSGSAVASSAAPSADPSATLTALRQAERAGRDAAARACAAAPAERAALLGSVAAARATHLEALR